MREKGEENFPVFGALVSPVVSMVYLPRTQRWSGSPPFGPRDKSCVTGQVPRSLLDDTIG